MKIVCKPHSVWLIYPQTIYTLQSITAKMQSLPSLWLLYLNIRPRIALYIYIWQKSLLAIKVLATLVSTAKHNISSVWLFWTGEKSLLLLSGFIWSHLAVKSLLSPTTIWALINSFLCCFCTSALGLVLFQIPQKKKIWSDNQKR